MKTKLGKADPSTEIYRKQFKELLDNQYNFRNADPKEIAQMVWNIVHAPEYMTGQIIGVDGGFL